jgi:TonB family protein
MREAVDDVLAMRAADQAGLQRAMRWSFGVHIVVLVLLFALPRDWLTKDRTPQNLIFIEVGGSPGPRSTGQTAIGGRTVEEVAPPERRPEPVRPSTSPPDTMTIPQRDVKIPPPPPPRTARPPSTVTRPPSRGQEVTRGNTAVETGARGEGTGLSFGGGGGTSGSLDVANFCCPEYIEVMRGTIDNNWNKNMPERGTSVMRFTIRRDGTIADIQVVQSSGSSLLDREAERTLRQTRLPPLPARFTEPSLGVRLTFPYEN